MENKRRLLRLEVKDFLQIHPLNESAKVVDGENKNLTLMGICFSSSVEWKKGQVLLIDYFLPEDLDSIKLKVMIVWSEYVDSSSGFFCGGEIVDMERDKQDKFANYYFTKLRERFY